jgi:hypothetical protein
MEHIPKVRGGREGRLRFLPKTGPGLQDGRRGEVVHRAIKSLTKVFVLTNRPVGGLGLKTMNLSSQV